MRALRFSNKGNLIRCYLTKSNKVDGTIDLVAPYEWKVRCSDHCVHITGFCTANGDRIKLTLRKGEKIDSLIKKQQLLRDNFDVLVFEIVP